MDGDAHKKVVGKILKSKKNKKKIIEISLKTIYILK